MVNDQVIAAESLQVEQKRNYLEEAATSYREQLDAARTAMRYAESAFTVLQREVQRNSDPAARDRALEILTEASRSATDIAATIQRQHETIRGIVARSTAFHNRMRFRSAISLIQSDLVLTNHPGLTFPISDVFQAQQSGEFNSGYSAPEKWLSRYFQAPMLVQELEPIDYTAQEASSIQWLAIADPGSFFEISNRNRFFHGVPSAVPVFEVPAVPTARRAAEDQQAYWRAIRDSLQQCLSVPLEKLAALIGIAYPTLVSLGRRRPHPSTSRAVLRLHALVSDFERVRGRDATIEWFATEGLAMLEKRGFDALKRAVIRTIYGRPRAYGGISLQNEPDPDPEKAADSGSA